MTDQLQMTEKRINNGIKRVLKQFPQYKLVNNIEQGDVAIIFNKKDTEYFCIVHIDSEFKEIFKNSTSETEVIIFLKHKNIRNTKHNVLSDITKKKFLKQK